MRWIDKQARHCQGYLADKRSLIPVTIILANAGAIWLLAYLISSVGTASARSSSAYGTAGVLSDGECAARPSPVKAESSSAGIHQAKTS
jgi:hypothetical protein